MERISTDRLVLLILFILLFIGAVYLLIKEIGKAQVEFVEKNSTKYADILHLNSVVYFQDIQGVIPLRMECSSKAQYDRFNGRDFLVSVVAEDRGRYEELIFQTKYNRKLYDMYQRDLLLIKPSSEARIKKLRKMSPHRFWEIEEQLCNELIIKPVLTPVIQLYVEYTSAQGRSHYSHTEIYPFEQIISILHDADEKNAYQETKQYQRSLMTDTLRYEVMKRDNFRCVLCGASAKDGVKLEVDHIKPVSKGGKTELSNLRTLCKNCNRGKRDRYDPYGVN